MSEQSERLTPGSGGRHCSTHTPTPPQAHDHPPRPRLSLTSSHGHPYTAPKCINREPTTPPPSPQQLPRPSPTVLATRPQQPRISLQTHHHPPILSRQNRYTSLPSNVVWPLWNSHYSLPHIVCPTIQLLLPRHDRLIIQDHPYYRNPHVHIVLSVSVKHTPGLVPSDSPTIPP